MISPPFTIRAKKPIIRPGMKRKKEEEEEEEEVTMGKHPKQEQIQAPPQPSIVDVNSGNFDFDSSLFDTTSWEIIEPPVEECFNLYNVMNIEDKKKLLEKILEVASFSERELLVSKLIKCQISTRDNYDQVVDKYFTDFGDLNL